jgi:hypothetical protein
MKNDSLVGIGLIAGAAFFGGISQNTHQKNIFKIIREAKKNPLHCNTSMSPPSYYRALATCSFLTKELENEKTAHQAMKLCFQKIHKSLDLFKGHLINRIRFHMDRHHTEYVRCVLFPSFASEWLKFP